jgi:hypothetical protein
MTHEALKFTGCIIVAVLSMGIHLWLKDQKDEIRRTRALVVAVWVGRFALVFVIYGLFPMIVRNSDAVRFYFPETLALMDGGLPYRDFPTHYSPLFHPLMAVGLWLWRSPGAIVSIMLIAEATILVNLLYLTRRQGRERLGWRCAWLIVSSPVMIYWVGVGGYNSVLIAAFAAAGLLSLARGDAWRTGWAGAFGLLTCKLLGVLTWPTLILFGRGSVWRKTLPLVLTGLSLVAMLIAGYDTLMPIKSEHNCWSGGNLWFLAAIAFPGLYRSGFSAVACPILLFLAALIGTLHMARKSRDASLAPLHLAWIILVFMLLSRKTMGMYMPMLMPFAVYALLLEDRGRYWLPLFLLGMLTTWEISPAWLEGLIADRYFTTTLKGALLLLADVIRVGCLIRIGLAVWSLTGHAPVEHQQSRRIAQGQDAVE